MPKAKKSLTVEVLDEPSPWLTAYKKFAGDDSLVDGEITVRGFAKLTGKSRSQAKSILMGMVREGMAEEIGKRILAQDGLQPARVSVYKLTNAKTRPAAH